jgi:surfactin synthase thioesterase subunit
MNSWIAYRKPDLGAKLRLFCFPHAGGGASVYKTWADQLPSGVEVCPIQPPGREERRGEAPYTRMSPLIGAIAGAILPLLDRPFAFFGHCLGARVAFELARFLRQNHNLDPVQLFISACPAPQLEGDGTIYNLPEDRLIDVLRVFDGTLNVIFHHRPLLKLFLPCIRADFEIFDTYTYLPGTLLHCPLTVFGGDTDPMVPVNQLSSWRELTTSRFDLQVVRGGHFFLHTVQPAILEILSAQLESLVCPTGAADRLEK